MKKVLSVGLLYLAFITGYTQGNIDFSDYKPLICKGDIPSDFKVELSKLVESEKKNSSNVSKSDKSLAVNFSEISNYQLNNILFSGNVLYGDELTEYVNKVADVILKDDQDLRDELSFYVLKNTDLNAYSTHRGIIFISMGLLAQIESEAQLAFILCHEIVHFRNKHSLETYKKREKVLSGKEDINSSKKISTLLNYSKDNELEADKDGLELFLKTPYGTNELNNLFDVMLYSYLPFDEIRFDTLYFNKGEHYVLPDAYFLSEVGEITAEEDVVDSMSTHPNIKKRREKIQDMLKTDHKKTGLSFVNGEAEFNKIQKIARYELAIIYLQDYELEQALYTGYLIEKVYGRSLFSDKIVAGALYAKAKEKTPADDDDYYIRRYASDDDDKLKWEKIEGESQAVYHFLHKIPAKELSVLASGKLLEGHKLYHDDFFSVRFNSIIQDMVEEYEFSKSDFLETYKAKADTLLADNNSDTESVNKKSTKVSKIKKSKATQTERKSKRKDNKYFQYAYTENYSDSLLVASFREMEARKKANDEKYESRAYAKYLKARRKLVKKHGEGLGIDKLVMVNPIYSSYISEMYDYHKYKVSNPDVTPLEEIAVEKNLLKYILDYSGDLKLEVDVIGSTQQNIIETDKFNDFQQLITWLSERVSIGKIGAYTYSDQYMQKYVEEYGHLGFCHVAKYNSSVELVFVLFDMKSGGLEFIYEKRFKKGKPDGALVKMMIYDVLHQIKQDPKKINKLKKRYHIDE